MFVTRGGWILLPVLLPFHSSLLVCVVVVVCVCVCVCVWSERAMAMGIEGGGWWVWGGDRE